MQLTDVDRKRLGRVLMHLPFIFLYNNHALCNKKDLTVRKMRGILTV